MWFNGADGDSLSGGGAVAIAGARASSPPREAGVLVLFAMWLYFALKILLLI